MGRTLHHATNDNMMEVHLFILMFEHLMVYLVPLAGNLSIARAFLHEVYKRVGKPLILKTEAFFYLNAAPFPILGILIGYHTT